MSTLTENKKKKTAIRGLGAALVGFAGWVVLLLVFGMIDPNILKINNILNLLRSMAKYLLVGVGQSVILITGNIDLSIGSVVAMSAMISATLMSKGFSIIIALLVALAACLVVGLVNGVLVGKFKLPPFIATLGTMFCARGVAYMANGNRNTDAISTGLGKEAGDAFQNFFYYGKTAGIYNAFWIAFIIFLAVFFIMSKTRTGRLGTDTRLNQLALVGLEQHALVYDVVQFATLDALAEGVVEAYVTENRNAQNDEQSRNATDLFHKFRSIFLSCFLLSFGVLFDVFRQRRLSLWCQTQ